MAEVTESKSTTQTENSEQDDEGGSILARLRQFFTNQKVYMSEKPFLSISYWIIFIANFFSFVCFLAPWFRVDGSPAACDEDGTIFYFLFRAEICCDYNENYIPQASKGCINYQLLNAEGDFDKDLKKAGAASFVFLLLAFAFGLVFQYLLHVRQRDLQPPKLLLSLYSAIGMATFSWVLSLFFMLSWAIYVGVVEDELQDGADGDRYSFGVAGAIINWILLLGIGLLLLMKWDSGESSEGKTVKNPMYSNGDADIETTGSENRAQSFDDNLGNSNNDADTT